MTKSNMEQRVHQALADLGESEEQVACTLYALGVSGVVRNAWTCPVANYLSQRLNRRVYIGYSIAVAVDTVCVLAYEHREVFSIPHPINKFIDKFDDGKYPELLNDDPCQKHVPTRRRGPALAAGSAGATGFEERPRQ